MNRSCSSPTPRSRRIAGAPTFGRISRTQSVSKMVGLVLLAIITACTVQVYPDQSVSPQVVLTGTMAKVTEPVQATQLPVSSFPGTIILGRPTAVSVTASMLADEDLQVALAYGTAPGEVLNHTGVASLKAHQPLAIEIVGLRPNTAYFYRVLYCDAGCSSSDSFQQSDEYTFHTQRAPGSAFTFTIDADPHNRDPRFNGELYRITLSNILNDRPDFHINLGDTFMTEKVKAKTYAEAESTFLDMRHNFGLIGTSVPLFLVNGNHEGELGWLLKGKDKELPIWSTRLRQLCYPNPTPGGFYSGSSTPDEQVGLRDGYYAWEWGEALFVVLDPFWFTLDKPRPDDLNNNWGWTLGKDQYDWLRQTLQNSAAPFKFIFTHHLVGGADKDARGGIEAASYFEWGGNNVDGSYGFDVHRPGWGTPIHQLLVENHVSIVFHGHDHVFVKQDLDGIVYQEVPQSSNAEYNNIRLAADYGYINGDARGGSGHLRVTVAPFQVTVEYVQAYLPQDEKIGQQNGQVEYVYLTIQKRLSR